MSDSTDLTIEQVLERLALIKRHCVVRNVQAGSSATPTTDRRSNDVMSVLARSRRSCDYRTTR